MSDSFAKTWFPGLYGKLERKKTTAANAPLSMADLNSLLSMYFNNKPLYPSVEHFFTDEYKKAVESGVSPRDLEKIQKFRNPTEEELNLLYCDLHIRDEKEQVTGSNQ